MKLDGERVRMNDDDGGGSGVATRETKGGIQEESYARNQARRKGMREWGEREDETMVRTFGWLIGRVNDVLVVDSLEVLACWHRRRRRREESRATRGGKR